MNFFKSKTNKFFWSMVAMGTLMVIVSLQEKVKEAISSPPPSSHIEEEKTNQKSVSETLRALQNQREKAHAEWSGIEDSGVPKMVPIDGKYYPVQKENIYEVKGERVLVIDNGRDRYTDKDHSERLKVGKGVRLQDSDVDEELSVTDAFNAKKMMKTLQNAKQNMEQKDIYLKELMKQ